MTPSHAPRTPRRATPPRCTRSSTLTRATGCTPPWSSSASTASRPVVLDLVWPQVRPDTRTLEVPGLTVHLDAATMDLLRWHGARQCLDRHRAGGAWQHSLRVFVDQTGRPYSETAADEAATIAAAKAGLPPITFAALRDLSARP